LALASLASVAIACPSWWNNPCVVRSGEYASPQWNRHCGRRGVSHSSGGPFGWPGGSPGYLHHNGVYLQSCSNACANSATCIAFALTNRWIYPGNNYRMGHCYLYDSCTPNQIQHEGSSEMWWMGTRAHGVTDSRCLRPERNFAFGCEKGTERGSNGKCTPCRDGYFKSNFGSNSCSACRVCPTGEFRHGGCSTTQDSLCKPHSGYCANTEFQIAMATGLQDRDCQNCKVCQPGEQILRGCARGDPWAFEKYNTDTSGNSKGDIAVFQAGSIANRAVVVHGHSGQKIGCGVLNMDPWKVTKWSSDSSGSSKGEVAAFQQDSIAGKVIVVHASDMTKVACGKITLDPWANQMYMTNAAGASTGRAAVKQETPVVGRTIVVHDPSMAKAGCGVIKMTKHGLRAVIGKMPGYKGKAPGGTFKIEQSNNDLSLAWDLSNLPGMKMGMFHIHAGNSCKDVKGHLENIAQMSVMLKKFPGYTGNINVKGSFQLGQAGSFVSGSYKFAGMETSKSGGYHIHAGTSCSNVGAHFENGIVYSADIKRFPGYTGDIKVGGGFGFHQKNNAVRGQYALRGLVANKMGMFHIHSGSSCDNVGSHLMNDPNVVHEHKRRLMSADHPGDQVTEAKDVVYDDADAKCSPCADGDTFSAVNNQAVCSPVTVCSTGYFVSTKPTVKSDTKCSKCTNSPAHSYYTTPGSSAFMNDCEFGCMEGWEKTNNGKNCAAVKQSIIFHRDTEMGIFSYDDNTIKVKGTCLDAEICSGKKESTSLDKKLDAIAATFCPLRLDSKNMKYNAKGFFVFEGGFCRYDCIGSCPEAMPFDQTAEYGYTGVDELDSKK